MVYFTEEEFKAKYPQYTDFEIADWEIEASCEMIYSQVGLIYRHDWNSTNVPLAIKNASMEQYRFILSQDIPFIDFVNNITAGAMSADLKSDYSTLALRMLANAGYQYRGVPLQQNMGIDIGFGG